jgi:hypothetical protein
MLYRTRTHLWRVSSRLCATPQCFVGCLYSGEVHHTVTEILKQQSYILDSALDGVSGQLQASVALASWKEQPVPIGTQKLCSLYNCNLWSDFVTHCQMRKDKWDMKFLWQLILRFRSFEMGCHRVWWTDIILSEDLLLESSGKMKKRDVKGRGTPMMKQTTLCHVPKTVTFWTGK